MVQRDVARETAAIVGAAYLDPRELANLAKPSNGRPMDPVAKVTAQALVISACLHANRAIRDWRGVSDPDTGGPVKVTDPGAIKRAMLDGAGPGRDPLLSAFVGWLQVPREPVAKDVAPLRVIGAGGKASLATEAARIAVSVLTDDPMLWIRDYTGEVEGLDYRNALMAFEDRCKSDPESPDYGAAFRCFAALENGRMELTHE